MTTIIRARNVNDALANSMWKLATQGVTESSRNGPVKVMPGPVITEYDQPMERVLFNKKRDANPYFHLMEALWMLGGRRDVEFPARFVKRMHEYSDDGATLRGAYGYRWRNAFAVDQLSAVIDMLRDKPSDRRAVIQMWDANVDLGFQGKDVPCNTHIYLRAWGATIPRLDMTVLCRSNDAVWGAHGANAVHFSVLQEYLAHYIGVAIGTLYQFSNNYHVYMDLYDPEALKLDYSASNCYYNLGMVEPRPMFHVSRGMWLHDLELFLANPEDEGDFRDVFFHEVAQPMYRSWMFFRRGEMKTALEWTSKIEAKDWAIACEEWLLRRAL